MTKTGPRDDTKLAAIKSERWPRSDWNRWPPSSEIRTRGATFRCWRQRMAHCAPRIAASRHRKSVHPASCACSGTAWARPGPRWRRLQHPTRPRKSAPARKSGAPKWEETYNGLRVRWDSSNSRVRAQSNDPPLRAVSAGRSGGRAGMGAKGSCGWSGLSGRRGDPPGLICPGIAATV